MLEKESAEAQRVHKAAVLAEAQGGAEPEGEAGDAQRGAERRCVGDLQRLGE